jgi:hypothetical protein
MQLDIQQLEIQETRNWFAGGDCSIQDLRFTNDGL